MVEASWNVMAQAQKPDLVFRRNGRVHLNRRGRQISRLLAAEVCASPLVMLDTPCSEVVCKTTHSTRMFPLYFPPPPCVTVCHHISTGPYSSDSSVTRRSAQQFYAPQRFRLPCTLRSPRSSSVCWTTAHRTRGFASSSCPWMRSRDEDSPWRTPERTPQARCKTDAPAQRVLAAVLKGRDLDTAQSRPSETDTTSVIGAWSHCTSSPNSQGYRGEDGGLLIATRYGRNFITLFSL